MHSSAVAWRAVPLWLGVCGLIVLGTFGPASAQQLRLEQPEWNRGYHGLAMLCRSLNLELQSNRNVWRRVPASESVLIVTGSIENLPVDLVEYTLRGGAVLVASDRSDLGTLARLGISFNRGPMQASSVADSFRRMNDCPIVTWFDDSSPVTAGLNSLVTNRPGYLRIRPGLRNTLESNWRTLSRLPFVRGQRSPPRVTYGPVFMASIESASGPGRALMIADHSILTNQMLTYGDNAALVIQALSWLKSGDRQSVLLLSNRSIALPLDPSQVAISLPPPKPSDVVAALRSLPPDALIDFGNSVVTAVEDEGVLDEVVSSSTRRMPIPLRNRMMMTAATIMLAMIALSRFFGTRAPYAISAVDLPPGSGGRRMGKRQAAADRSRAAEMLFRRFRDELVGHAVPGGRALAVGLRVGDGPHGARKTRRDIIRLDARLRKAARPARIRWTRPYRWTTRRLTELESQITHWRRLHAVGVIRYDSPDAPT